MNITTIGCYEKAPPPPLPPFLKQGVLSRYEPFSSVPGY